MGSIGDKNVTSEAGQCAPKFISRESKQDKSQSCFKVVLALL